MSCPCAATHTFELTHSRLVPPASIASLAHTRREWCAHGIEETDLGDETGGGALEAGGLNMTRQAIMPVPTELYGSKSFRQL
jgi:hypothetical protein